MHYFVVAIISFGLCIIAIAQARLNFELFWENFPGISFLVLIPWQLWLGLIIIFSILLNQRLKYHRVLIVLVGAFSLGIIFNFPNFVVNYPIVYDSYFHYSSAEVIAQYGKLMPNLSNYHSWPGCFIVTGSIRYITGMSGMSMMSWFPFYWGIMLLLGLMCLTTSLFSAKEKWSILGCATFLGCLAEASSLQNHLSPQAFGMLLLIFLMAALTKRFFLFNEIGWPSIFLSLMFFIALTISHAPSALIAFFIICLGFTLSWIPPFHEKQNSSYSFLLVVMIIFVSWQLYSVVQFKTFVLQLIDAIQRILSATLFEKASYLHAGKPENILLTALSYFRHGIFLGTSCLGLFFLYRAKEWKAIWAIITISGASIVFFLFTVGFSSGMLWERLLLFGTLPAALGVGGAILYVPSRLKKILNICLVLTALMGVVLFYDFRSGDIVPQQEFTTAQFLKSFDHGGIVTTYTNALVKYYSVEFAQKNIIVVPPEYKVAKIYEGPPPNACFVSVSGQLARLLGVSDYDMLLTNLGSQEKIYTNGFNRIFKYHENKRI